MVLDMKWSKEAKDKVSKVPFFVRKRVQKRVEEEAVRCGAEQVKLEHVLACQKRFLNRMEDEVKGFQVETCFGPSGCPNRAIKSDGLPEKFEKILLRRNLRDFLKKRVDGPLKIHHEFRVSVSDCPNACSRPQIVDVGFIGASKPKISGEICNQCGECERVCREGAISVHDSNPVISHSNCLSCGQCAEVCPTGTLQEDTGGYRVLIGGKLGRHPRLGAEISGIYEGKDVLLLMDRILDHYQYHCKKGERLGEILERTGLDCSFPFALDKIADA